MPLGQVQSRSLMATIIAVIILSAILTYPSKQEPISVGIVYSFDQPSEAAIASATLMAIKELNYRHGLLGKTVEAIIIDGKSSEQGFSSAAESLINDHNISVIFGCSSPVCRQTLKPIIEKHDRILFYPASFQGLENSDNVFYTGSIPNQWITPSIAWSVDNIGRRLILIGNASVFSRTTHEMIKKQLQALNAELVLELYTDSEPTQWQALFDSINNKQADLVINTLNRQDSVELFKQLNNQLLTIATLSFQLSASDMQSIDASTLGEHYLASSYFQTLNTAINHDFVERFNHNMGQHYSINNNIVAAYSSVHLWANAVIKSNTTDPSIIRTTLKGESFNSPEGIIQISTRNNYSWKAIHVAKLTHNATPEIIWSSQYRIRPQAFPLYKSHQQWQKIIDDTLELNTTKDIFKINEAITKPDYKNEKNSQAKP